MNTSNTKRYLWLEDIFGGTIDYLKSCPGICEVKVGSRINIAEKQIQEWENANTPFLLPNDLKSFYRFSDGLLINWNVQFNDNNLPMGQMQVNSLEKLAKIHISMNDDLVNKLRQSFVKIHPYVFAKSLTKTTKIMTATSSTESIVENNNNNSNKSNNNIDSNNNCEKDGNNNNDNKNNNNSNCNNNPKNNQDDIMSGYLIYDCKTYGKVILLYHSKIPYDPQVWFLDSSNEWNFLSVDFISYFRLMVKNLGIYGWQMAYTKRGLYQSTLDWLSFYAPDRALLYRKNQMNKKKENSKIQNERSNPNNESQLLLMKFFGYDKNDCRIFNSSEIKKAQLSLLKKNKVKKANK